MRSGADALLMVDAGGSDAFWPHGLQLGAAHRRHARGYDVAWFEEPLRPDALEDYVALRRAQRRSRSPAARSSRGGRASCPGLQAAAFDIVQPDTTKVGGLSEQRRIGWMAYENGIRLIPHGWNTAIGLAADLQLASALPGTDLVEYIAGSPYIDDLATEGWKLDDDGMLAVPDTPGLGVQLDTDRLAR